MVDVPPLDVDPRDPEPMPFPDQWRVVADQIAEYAGALRLLADEAERGRTCRPDCDNPLCSYDRAAHLLRHFAAGLIADASIIENQATHIRATISRRN